jgi:hypothetical protein
VAGDCKKSPSQFVISTRKNIRKIREFLCLASQLFLSHCSVWLNKYTALKYHYKNSPVLSLLSYNYPADVVHYFNIYVMNVWLI